MAHIFCGSLVTKLIFEMCATLTSGINGGYLGDYDDTKVALVAFNLSLY
jgi:hypothetical protein